MPSNHSLNPNLPEGSPESACQVQTRQPGIQRPLKQTTRHAVQSYLLLRFRAKPLFLAISNMNVPL